MDNSVVADAATVRAQAEQHRNRALEARAEADTILTTARAQAARLVADAEQRARQLTADAVETDRAAAPLEERAGYLAHAEQLRQQITDAEQHVIRLAQEHEQLQDTMHRLGERLAKLGEQHQTTSALLAAAREAGDVDTVTELRSRLTALEEVTAEQQGRQQAAQLRQQAIGEPTGLGELAAAAKAWQGLTGELRRIENILNPERPEAITDRLLEGLDVALAAGVERMAREKATNSQRSWAPTTVISRR